MLWSMGNLTFSIAILHQFTCGTRLKLTLPSSPLTLTTISAYIRFIVLIVIIISGAHYLIVYRQSYIHIKYLVELSCSLSLRAPLLLDKYQRYSLKEHIKTGKPGCIMLYEINYCVSILSAECWGFYLIWDIPHGSRRKLFSIWWLYLISITIAIAT